MYGVQSSVHVWGNAPRARIVTKQQRCSLLYGLQTLYKSVPAGGARALLDMGSIRHSQGYYDMTGTGARQTARHLCIAYGWYSRGAPSKESLKSQGPYARGSDLCRAATIAMREQGSDIGGEHSMRLIYRHQLESGLCRTWAASVFQRPTH